MQALLSSHLLNPRSIGVLSKAADALAQSSHSLGPASPTLGVIGVLKQSQDPDVMRAVTFLADVGRNFGRDLQRPRA